MGFWDFDHDSFAWLYPPVRRRVRKFIAWLRALISQAKYIFLLLKAYRDKCSYDLDHTGQVCRLEGVLNDAFDDVGRTIYITDPVYVDPVYLYRRDELKPVYLYRRSESLPVYLYRRSEIYDGSAVQFIINVPAAVWAVVDHSQFRALVNKYRLVSKLNYTIVTF